MLEQSPQKSGEEILELILLAKNPGFLKGATGGECLERLNEAVRTGTLQELPDRPGPAFDQRPRGTSFGFLPEAQRRHVDVQHFSRVVEIRCLHSTIAVGDGDNRICGAKINANRDAGV